jgi:hypothetical protein
MPESIGLPPAPWRLVEDEEWVVGIVDADGVAVLSLAEKERCPDPVLFAEDRIFAAILALPLLVEAARYMVGRFDKFENADDPLVFPSSLHKAAQQLRDVLAQIDGGGNNGGKPQ